MEEPKRTWPTESSKQSSHGSTMTETTSKVSEPGPLNICYSYEKYVIGVFVEILTVGADLSLSLLLVLGTLFLLFSCLVHPWYEDFCSCLIISCFFLVWLLSVGGLLLSKGE